MIERVTLDAKQVRKAIKILNDADPQIVKDLKRELKSKLSPLAQQVAEAVPREPALSRFGGSTATSWGPVRHKISVTPGRSRESANRLVAIQIEQKTGRGVYIAELAGTRSSGKTGQGRHMIKVLNERQPLVGKGGRYIWAKFRLLRPDIYATAERILDATFSKLEKML